jgi:hypothetical protein
MLWHFPIHPQAPKSATFTVFRAMLIVPPDDQLASMRRTSHMEKIRQPGNLKNISISRLTISFQTSKLG